MSNAATGRPVYGDRFHTANEEGALLSRGFQYGSQPGALVIGWNSYHTAVTLPDGTNVSSGEGGGVRVGGGGAYQRQFTHHMYLPTSLQDAGIGESDVDNGTPVVEPVDAPVELVNVPGDVVEAPVQVVEAPVQVVEAPVETAVDPVITVDNPAPIGDETMLNA